MKINELASCFPSSEANARVCPRENASWMVRLLPDTSIVFIFLVVFLFFTLIVLYFIFLFIERFSAFLSKYTVKRKISTSCFYPIAGRLLYRTEMVTCFLVVATQPKSFLRF